MVQCAGIKRDGGKCTATVEPPNEYCWWHDPNNATQRKRAAAKGGKSKPNRELAGIRQLLEELTDRVLRKEGTEHLDTGPAAVANQLINTRLRAIEVERKIRETEELEARIEALEFGGEGGRRWGS